MDIKVGVEVYVGFMDTYGTIDTINGVGDHIESLDIMSEDFGLIKGINPGLIKFLEEDE